MKATLFTREEHAGPQACEEVEVSSYEEAVKLAAGHDVLSCGCCRPAVRVRLPSGVLKADPDGYWIACRHGRWACYECGDPALPYPDGYTGEFGPVVGGTEYITP